LVLCRTLAHPAVAVPHCLFYRAQELQSSALPSTRIQPDRRWFGNTRVVEQKKLDAFREEMVAKLADPRLVLLREKKLPLQLLEDPQTAARRGGKCAHTLVNLLLDNLLLETPR
jgi:hypothetical protein